MSICFYAHHLRVVILRLSSSRRFGRDPHVSTHPCGLFVLELLRQNGVRTAELPRGGHLQRFSQLVVGVLHQHLEEGRRTQVARSMVVQQKGKVPNLIHYMPLHQIYKIKGWCSSLEFVQLEDPVYKK